MDAIRRARGPARLQKPEPVVEVAAEGQKILLVYLFEGLGDVLLLGPALKAVLDQGPKRLAVLTTKKGARGLKLLDLPLRIITIADELLLDVGDPGWAAKNVKTAAEKLQATLHKAKFDIAVDLSLRGSLESRRWIEATGAEHRLGWRRQDEALPIAALTQSCPDIRWQCERHWSKVQLLPLAPLGVRNPNFAVDFAIKEASLAKAETFWGSGPRVVLIPGSRSAAKRFAPEHFEAVAKHVNTLGGSVVVAGAPSERALLKQVATAGQGKVYSQKSLEVLATMIRGADAVVCNDTGPMHMAFLMGRPTVAVFTQMSALVWGPFELHARYRVLQAPEEGPSDVQQVWSRAVVHALDVVLSVQG